MLDNATRRQLLNRHKASGFPGSIIDVYNAYNQGIDLISQFEMSNQPQMQVANTPQQQQEGLRPFHQQGQTNQSMVFPNVPPNTNFNTVGMKAPINIKKIDNQGNLVKSYENVPPGIQSLPTGPVGGTVIETPANMQSGGVRKYQAGSSPDPDLAPGITQLPVADVQTDRVPYSKISDNSRMMGVGWAKPFFEAAGNNPDSKLYEIGQRILNEREQDLARAEMAMEFTSVPGLMRTAERLKGKDPLRTIAKEGKLDLVSTLPLAGGMYRGLRLAEKSAGDLYDAYKLGRVARELPEQLPGSGNALNLNKRSSSLDANNQLPPPPPEIYHLIDGPTYQVRFVDLRRQISGTGNRYLNASTSYKPKRVNQSGLTKEEVLQKASDKDKEAISRMSETEFENTVLKPNGDVVPAVHGKTAEGVTPISTREYAAEFNAGLDDLNEIIKNKNKSGIEYRITGIDTTGIDPYGVMTIHTPTQTLPNNRVIEAGETRVFFNINPGRWGGVVEDIPSRGYYDSIPGLSAANTSGGIFPEVSGLKGTPGTNFYDSINEYLKTRGLGRLKDGKSGQSRTKFDPTTGEEIQRGSFEVWEGNINKGKAVGFYESPRQVAAVFRNVAVPIGVGVGAVGASAEEAKTTNKYGGLLRSGGVRNKVPYYNKLKN